MTNATNPLDDPKKLHDFLFNMYDFTSILLDKMLDMKKPYATDASMYVYMAYIEDFMDTYGRGLIVETAKKAGLNSDESLAEAHARLDTIRSMLNRMKELPPAHAEMDTASRRLKNNWGSREDASVKHASSNGSKLKKLWHKILRRLKR